MATALATVAAALLGALTLWVVWRARAAAARREELARALEQIAADGSGLVAATLVSLDVADPGGSPDQLAEDLELARAASRATALLLDAARAYANRPDQVVESAEGCTRVGVGVARSRGLRVRLRGDRTDLDARASVGEACEVIVSLIETTHAAADPERRFADVELCEDEVRFAPGAPAAAVAARHELPPELRARAERCGWTLAAGAGGGWTIRRATDEPSRPTSAALEADEVGRALAAR